VRVLRSAELGRFTLDRTAPGICRAVALPADFPSGPARLQLVMSDAWRPHDTGHGADTRALGIRIRRIWSAPAAASARA
jgi:hypothetical protein